MKTLLHLAAGLLVGAVIGLWLPRLAIQSPAYPLPSEQAGPEDQAEADAPSPPPAAVPPRTVPLRVSIAEVLHTGDPHAPAGEIEEISGNLPEQLRFRWMNDPASGLAPAFLWQNGDDYRLGDRRVAPQDGDIRAAYAFDAPALLPDQYGGRLIFHRKLLLRLLEWSATLPDEPGGAPIVVSVEKIDSATVRLGLPAVASNPATHLTVTL